LPTVCNDTLDACVNVWINELHYDNSNPDADEGVEIAGRATVDLSGWTVVLYDGGNGQSYATITLSGAIPDQQAGSGTRWFAQAGIANGPDGLALVAPGALVVQFLSYEGSFTASDGPANGMTSVTIGVSEPGNQAAGRSLQLQGTGNAYANFTWAGPIDATRGAVNTGQTFN
jgi:hypothetical protein